MSREHVVQAGEHLSSLAARFGFRSYRTLWNAAANAPLREKRKKPTQLVPGDLVMIPDSEERVEAANTGQRHTFFVDRSRLFLRIRVEDPFGDPLPGAECKLTVDGEAHEVIADAEGIVEREISPFAIRASLIVEWMEFPILLGHLEPIDQTKGIEARLVNLGYYPNQIGSDDDSSLRFAVALFQCDENVSSTGATSDVAGILEETHGT